ncbi:hypothetical protein KCV03_g208, partial [Aureobasidium melanogenum]
LFSILSLCFPFSYDNNKKRHMHYQYGRYALKLWGFAKGEMRLLGSIEAGTKNGRLFISVMPSMINSAIPHPGPESCPTRQQP